MLRANTLIVCTVKLALCLSVSLFLTACASVDAGNKAPSFVVLGDRTGGHRPGIFSDMVSYAQKLPAQAWLSVGDSIEGYTEDRRVLAQQWQEFDRLVAAVKPPLHLVPGNHDISNAVQKQVWQERYGPTYSSVRYGDVLILLMDTEDPPILLPPEIIRKQNELVEHMQTNPDATQAAILKASKGAAAAPKLPGSVAISDQQLQWARQTLLENEDAQWTIVVMHKPAWYYNNPAFLQLEELLKRRDYLVLAGHEHYFKHEQRFGRDYITMATCGGVWLQDGPGRFDHVLSVEFLRQVPVIHNHIMTSEGVKVERLN